MHPGLENASAAQATSATRRSPRRMFAPIASGAAASSVTVARIRLVAECEQTRDRERGVER